MRNLIEIPETVAAALERAAASIGTTPEGWIADQLSRFRSPDSTIETPVVETLGKQFAGLFGKFSSDGQGYSLEGREMIGDHLEAKRVAGHL